jgi:DNA-binding CsgD family transcriptional regulator
MLNDPQTGRFSDGEDADERTDTSSTDNTGSAPVHAVHSFRPINDDLRRSAAKVFLLSARQREVVEYLADGLDNKAIARRMDKSEATTKQYVSTILQKLGVQSRLQAGLVGLIALKNMGDGPNWVVYSADSDDGGIGGTTSPESAQLRVPGG